MGSDEVEGVGIHGIIEVGSEVEGVGPGEVEGVEPDEVEGVGPS